MANEFTPELNDAVLQSLLKKIQEAQAQNVAAARGEASRRGIAGGSFEGSRIGRAEAAGQQASTDTMVQLAMENAQRQREERLTAEQRAYETSTQERQNKYNSLEAEKQMAWQSGEADKARAFQAEQDALNRENEAAAQKYQMLGGALGAVGNIVGSYLGNKGLKNALSSIGGGGANPVTASSPLASPLSLIGGTGLSGGTGAATGATFGSTSPMTYSTAGGPFAGTSVGGGGMTGSAGYGAGQTLGGTPGASSMFGSLPSMGSILSGGANLFGGAFAGQNLAKLTGKNTREAKFGSLAGAGLGTALSPILGPYGGLIGGAAGGLLTKGIQGVGKSLKNVTSGRITKAIKSWCFSGDTKVKMADGSEKYISKVSLGDNLLDGGPVYALYQAVAPMASICDYKGVIVSGFHAVKEGDEWIRVHDSAAAKESPLQNETMIVYCVSNENHKIRVKDILFADFDETDDEYEFDSLDDEIDFLNEQGVN